MDLAYLQQQLSLPRLAPLEQWDPPYCGDLPITIAADGRWLYQGSVIERLPLVKLLASVLIRQQDEYFLITPQEKMRIAVEDAAFMLVAVEQLQTDTGLVIKATTNLQHECLIGAEHPLLLCPQGNGQLLPYLQLWRGLTAKCNRSCYYQLVQWASADESASELLLQSAGHWFSLGALTDQE